MKETPLLFSAPMIRALLDGRKTQTRRIIKVQPPATALDAGVISSGDVSNGTWSWLDSTDLMDAGIVGDDFRCPYGVPGDCLWVRETFYAYGRWVTRYSAKKKRDEWHFLDMTIEFGHQYAYATDEGGHPVPMAGKRHGGVTAAWWRRPAIFMPRIASRITLELTGVRVERLHDISEDDAQAEGTPCYVCGGALDGCSEDDCHCFHHKATAIDYRNLWESINGRDSWNINPWVWAISFRRIEA